MGNKDRLRAQGGKYALQHLTTHLKDQGRHDRLFQSIEEQAHLAKQAESVEGFQLSSRSLEQDVLAAAIEDKDWIRFVRYSLVALNLREISVALSDEPILRSLMRFGQGQWAHNLVAQLPDPQQRARARAVILAEGGDSGDGRELQALLEDLQGVPSPRSPEKADQWLETLLVLARLLDPRTVRGEWSPWIARLEAAKGTDEPTEPTQSRARKAWRAVAERWLAVEVGRGSGLWQALDGMGDGEEASRFLVRGLAQSSAADLSLLEGSLPPLLEKDETLRSHVRIALLSRRELMDAAALDEAMRSMQSSQVAWSPELVEAGSKLWPQLGADRLRELAKSVEDGASQAALWIVAAEQCSRIDLPESLIGVIENIEDEGIRIHWTLRYLALGFTTHEHRDLLRRAGADIERLQFEVEASDLARWLDTIAVQGRGKKPVPTDLRLTLQRLAWSPITSPETLRRLAAEASETRVLEALHEGAEEYAAAVCGSASEGFGLRCDLICQTASRLCTRTGDDSILQEAAKRLLPEEEDRLRSVAVEKFCRCRQPASEDGDSVPDAGLETAQRIAQGIRSRRLQFLAELRMITSPEALHAKWAPEGFPSALYGAVTTAMLVEEELLALKPLQEKPLDPGALARDSVGQILDPDRRVQALIDLAWHTLDFQKRNFPRRYWDPSAALRPLALAAGGSSSDERLLALTPALVEVGAQVGSARGTAEFQEAFLRVLRLERVEPGRRIRVLAKLVERMGPAVLGEEESPGPARCRALVGLMGWILHLPGREEFQGETVGEIWPRLLPILLAAEDHLPSLCRAYLLHPLRTRICVDWLPTVTKALGLERFWGLLGAVARLLPGRPPGYDRRRKRARILQSWSAPIQRPLLEAWSQGDSKALYHFGRAFLKSSKPVRLEGETLVYALCGHDPDLALKVLRRLPAGSDRDALSLRLVQASWLPAQKVREVADLCGSGAASLLVQIWNPSLATSPDRVVNLAKLLSGYGLDPLDPENAPLRRALRQRGQPADLPLLAEATRKALSEGGKLRGEQALRFWLDVFLGGRGTGSRPFDDLVLAGRQAASLSPPFAAKSESRSHGSCEAATASEAKQA